MTKGNHKLKEHNNARRQRRRGEKRLVNKKAGGNGEIQDYKYSENSLTNKTEVKQVRLWKTILKAGNTTKACSNRTKHTNIGEHREAVTRKDGAAGKRKRKTTQKH